MDHELLNERMQKGLAHHRDGNLQEAVECYSAILTDNPENADVLYLLGVAFSQQGCFEMAAPVFRDALIHRPNNPVFHNGLANALQETGSVDEALEHYAKALLLNPNYAEAYRNQGMALQKAENHKAAAESFRNAVRTEPDSTTNYLLLAEALLNLGRHSEALDVYVAALAARDSAQVWNLRGATLGEQGHHEEALVCFSKAIALEEHHFGALLNRSVAFTSLSRLSEALENIDRLIALQPENASANNLRGHILSEMRQFPEAIANFEQAYRLNPDLNFLVGNLVSAKLKVCDWKDLPFYLLSLESKIQLKQLVTQGFAYLAFADSPPTQKIVEETWTKRIAPDNDALGPIPKRLRPKSIKIGYYSADFHNHATAFLMAELFELHDRSRFEVFGFSFGPDVKDEMRQRLTRAFDHFHDVRLHSPLEIAKLSRDIGIDIAVDLKGKTSGSRPQIFAFRCAPLQVNYLGYPGTSGAPYIDYLVADSVLIPDESREHFTEHIAYLPDSYQCNDRKRSLSAKRITRAEAGLPNDSFVFCCFNNNYKIQPVMFDVWMRLLQAVAGSVLWLFEANSTAATNLRKEAQQRGVDPQRLVFAPFQPNDAHLARYTLADLFLDTFPCNAHTTASDALWAGLPVLTLQGEGFAARVASSLLSAVGLSELITTTTADYEALALSLAHDQARLQDLRDRLVAARPTAPLFDTPRFTRHLEHAFEQMMARYYQELAPAHLYIPRIDAPEMSDHPDNHAGPNRSNPDRPLESRSNKGLEAMVNEVRSVLDKEGLEATFAYVNRITATDGRHLTGQARILARVAAAILRTQTATAIALLEHAKILAPEFADPYFIPISFFDSTGEVERARNGARFVIEADSATPEQIIIASQFLTRTPSDADAGFKAAKAAFDNLGKPLAWASQLLDRALFCMDWVFARDLIEQLSEAYSQGIVASAQEDPHTHMLWCPNQSYNLKAAKLWSERDLPLPREILPSPEIQAVEGRRIRVGYLSSDFRNHATSFLVNGLLRNHDPARVELFAYCSGWDDGSNLRGQVLSHFPHVYSLQGVSDGDAAHMIRSHAIDVLVELNGPTKAHRMGILAYRPAPVQISYLGFPGSVGGRVVDYIVGDSYTVKERTEETYPERIIFLDMTYQVNDFAALPPLSTVTRASQGLPEGVPIIGMFNGIKKVRGEVWKAWMQILSEVPEAVLWILDAGKHTDHILDRVSKACGITQGKRIYIAPKKSVTEHLERLQCADLMLDPWPCGGHTTTSESLFAGVPVLALEGTNFPGRVSGSLLRAAGLECMIQPTIDDYVRTAVHLLRHRPDELARLQRFVREEVPKTDIFDARSKARQLESAYRIALERAAKGLAPIHIATSRPNRWY